MSLLRSRATTILGYAHVAYLGVLPALATFALLYSYGNAAPLLLLLAGTVAVSVYLAVIISYTPFTTSLFWSVLILIDGPVWVALSLRKGVAAPFAFAIESFLLDGTAIWISILAIAIRSPLPTDNQRRASIALMLVSLLGTGWLVWPYYRDALAADFGKRILLSVGVIEAVVVRYGLIRQDEVVRKENVILPYVVVLVSLWVAAMIGGNVLHEMRVN